MRGIKPGRAPSWGGVIGGIVALIFGVFWLSGVSAAGAPPFFALFGVIFILCAIGGIIYNLYNATSSNRFSEYDITEPGEETDPLEPEKSQMGPMRTRMVKPRFCPFCGSPLKQSFEFCPQCGKEL